MIGNVWLFWTCYRGPYGIRAHEAWRASGYFVALPAEAGTAARQWFAPIEDEL